MPNLVVTLHSQHGVDEKGRLQTHQWAEIPDELSVVYMTGGLKRVRRIVETYFRYDFQPQLRRWVRCLWHRGEPEFMLRYVKQSILHLGRLRQSGTVDAYRGHLEILGGGLLDPHASREPMPWPPDLPWAAPTAGEFDIQAEQVRPPYLGVFELRVYRRPSGCTLHLFVRDLPLLRHGLKASLWSRPWMPLTEPTNLGFLRAEISQTALEQNHKVQFEMRSHDGIPQPLAPIRAVEESFSRIGPGNGHSH